MKEKMNTVHYHEEDIALLIVQTIVYRSNTVLYIPLNMKLNVQCCTFRPRLSGQ